MIGRLVNRPGCSWWDENVDAFVSEKVPTELKVVILTVTHNLGVVGVEEPTVDLGEFIIESLLVPIQWALAIPEWT